METLVVVRRVEGKAGPCRGSLVEALDIRQECPRAISARPGPRWSRPCGRTAGSCCVRRPTTPPRCETGPPYRCVRAGCGPGPGARERAAGRWSRRARCADTTRRGRGQTQRRRGGRRRVSARARQGSARQVGEALSPDGQPPEQELAAATGWPSRRRTRRWGVHPVARLTSPQAHSCRGWPPGRSCTSRSHTSGSVISTNSIIPPDPIPLVDVTSRSRSRLTTCPLWRACSVTGSAVPRHLQSCPAALPARVHTVLIRPGAERP